MTSDRVEELLETFIGQRLYRNRSGPEVSRLLRRELGAAWKGKSIHEIGKRDVVDLVGAIEQRGAPVAANKVLKSIKTFFPGAWAERLSINLLQTACLCRARKSLTTVF